MPMIFGGAGTTGLNWGGGGGIGRDPNTGKIMATDSSLDTSLLESSGWKSKLGQELREFLGGTTKPAPNMPGGIYKGAGGGGGAGGTTSYATGGSVAGPYNSAAQIAQVNSEFAGIMKRGLGQINEDAAARGAYSGGVPQERAQRYITDTGNAQAASIERIMNDILGRNQNWALQQQQFDWQKQLQQQQGGGSQRYGTSNQNQDITEMYRRLMGGMGGGGGGGAPGGAPGGGGAGGGGAMDDPKTGEPIRGTPDYFNRWQRWFRNKQSGGLQTIGPSTTTAGIAQPGAIPGSSMSDPAMYQF